ncbi:MAG TPA: hypothetical protein VHG91_20365 [Longimicrobium sp.]|nr:hypothetical protein [Longimicrobium sp.]
MSATPKTAPPASDHKPGGRRARAVERVRARLMKRSSPRLQMIALLAVTGGVGFGAAVAMLEMGLRSMAIRYPLALGIAYAAFLLLLRLWLRAVARRRERRRSRGGDFDLDVLDVGIGRGGGGSKGPEPRFGGGGGFAGGGAEGGWGPRAGIVSSPVPAPMATPVPVPAPSAPAASLSSATTGGGKSPGGGWGLDLDFDADDAGPLIALVLVVVALVAIVAAAGYVIAAAPVLLAELVVDGVVLVGLYGSVRRIDESDWLRTAVRKTWIPALVLALLLGAVGYGIQWALPQARSIGDVWRLQERVVPASAGAESPAP